MKAILLGNGPSSKYYSSDLEGYKVGFNMTEADVDVIFASDQKVIKRQKNNPKLKVLPKPFMTQKGGINVAWNTGHNAYNHLRTEGYDEFELYGFDLLFSNNWVSSTDRVFNKDSWVRQAIAADLNTEWIRFWNELIDVSTIIHAPKGSRLHIENNKNVGLKYHEDTDY
tara:strand:+ start:1366 stop:1872 length:507 start_codon:yes stop_codon:yes gene_type:complete